MLERLLIVGFGSIGQRHARIAREMVPGAEIAVLRHRAGSTADGADRTVTSLADAIAFRPQAAVIASPAPHHVEAATALADAGAHLLIEKPIAGSSAGVADLIAKCRSRSLALMTGYNLRFLPSLQRFRELVLEGRVGRPLSVRAEVGQYLPSWRPDSDYRQTVSARAALGGGVLLELSHEIDYLRWLFGDVAWVSAVLRKVSDLDVNVEDCAHLLLGFAKNKLVATLSMDFVRRDSVRTCTIVGDRGTLKWDAIRGTIQAFDGADGWSVLFEQRAARDDSYIGEWREFLRCIEQGRAPEPSGADGLAVLRVVEAARESDRSGAVARVGL